MYILVESGKGRYDQAIETTVLAVSDSKEFLARYLEGEIRDRIAELDEEEAEEVTEEFEAIKNGGPYNEIEISGEYIEVDFVDGLLMFCSTGCPRSSEYAGETKQILEIKSPDVIDEFREVYGFLSNFHICNLNYDGNNYRCAENAFQAMKERNPAKRSNYFNLLPSEAKRMGHTCKLRPDWEEVKLDIMYDILKAKFSDKELRERLLLTGDKELIEGNDWHDNFWGNCFCKKCKSIEGKNMLGKLLMKLRSELNNKKD